jgi:menaquinone-dependent protoporphyrinogen oxidase
MKTAIIYASKYGTTEKVARLLAENLKETDDIILVSLAKKNTEDINQFDKIILGTSIYAGNPSRKMKLFYTQYQTFLLQKTIGLFICGMEPDKEKRQLEIQNAYPNWLHEKAKIAKFLGGEFLFEKMNFFEKLIIKKIAQTNTSVSNIDYVAVQAFAENMKG